MIPKDLSKFQIEVTESTIKQKEQNESKVYENGQTGNSGHNVTDGSNADSGDFQSGECDEAKG